MGSRSEADSAKKENRGVVGGVDETAKGRESVTDSHGADGNESIRDGYTDVHRDRAVYVPAAT